MWPPIETEFFFTVLSLSLTRQNKLNLETLRLLESFQEFSSVFFNVESSFASIANKDIGDISSLSLLLGSSSVIMANESFNGISGLQIYPI